jgi:surface antigen
MALSATAVSADALAAISPSASSASMARPAAASTAPVTTSAPTSPATTSATTSATTTPAQRSQSAISEQGVILPWIAFYSAWQHVPGRQSYSMHDFRGDPYAASFGQCTWYAWYRHQGQPLMRLGNAGSWPSRAPSFGLRVSSRPVAGATVIFSPGVQGASAVGHAGVVERVLSGGWMLISEMNFYWNGGGWGRVDYRYAHVGTGVKFIFR